MTSSVRCPQILTLGLFNKRNHFHCRLAGNYRRSKHAARNLDSYFGRIVGKRVQKTRIITHFICDDEVRDAIKRGDNERALQLVNDPNCYEQERSALLGDRIRSQRWDR